ncbi:MAG: sulfatase-like hydrolase/transferase [Clostridia bacterium]|nr:sulfatase-like hydrolase/transferase [Clostridia bacterium]
MTEQEKTQVKKKKKFMNKERKRRILPSVLLAVGIPLLIFIVIPLELWCNNLAELNYHITDVLLPLILLFFAAAILIFSALFFVPKTAYRVLRGLVVGGGLMIFLQSNFLNGEVTGLLGDDIYKAVDLVGMPMAIFNAVIWVVVIAGCVVASLLIKKQKIVRTVSTVIAAILCFTQAVGVVTPLVSADFAVLDNKTYEAKLKEDPNYQYHILSNKNMTTLATDRNVVVFVIDRFDEILYCQPNLEYLKEKMDGYGGFTHFSDNISRYGHTYPALAHMLTDADLQLNEKRLDFFKRAYTQNQTLSRLKAEGYSVNVYTDDYYAYDDAYYFADWVDNAEWVSPESVYREIVREETLIGKNLAVALTRVLPHALKDMVPVVSSVSLNSNGKMTSTELSAPRTSTDMKQAYETVATKDFVKAGEKKFSLIHLSGCHDVPYDDNWETASGSERSNILISLKNSFKIIDEYIAEMKKAGVYDNSTIIITGDHAHSIDSTIPIKTARLTALFVKPSTVSSGEMATNVAQVSHENLWATIFKSEEIDYDTATFGESVFDISETEMRTRTYYWEIVRKPFVQETYTIVGKGSDFANWTKISARTANKSLYE